MFHIVAGSLAAIAAEQSVLLEQEQDHLSKSEYLALLEQYKKPYTEEKFQEQFDRTFSKAEEELLGEKPYTRAPTMQRLGKKLRPVFDTVNRVNEEYVNKPAAALLNQAVSFLQQPNDVVSLPPKEAKQTPTQEIKEEVYNMFVKKKPVPEAKQEEKSRSQIAHEEVYNMFVKKKSKETSPSITPATIAEEGISEALDVTGEIAKESIIGSALTGAGLAIGIGATKVASNVSHDVLSLLPPLPTSEVSKVMPIPEEKRNISMSDKSKRADGSEPLKKLKSPDDIARKAIMGFGINPKYALMKLATDYSVGDIETILRIMDNGIYFPKKGKTYHLPKEVAEELKGLNAAEYISKTYQIHPSDKQYKLNWGTLRELDKIESAHLPDDYSYDSPTPASQQKSYPPTGQQFQDAMESGVNYVSQKPQVTATDNQPKLGVEAALNTTVEPPAVLDQIEEKKQQEVPKRAIEKEEKYIRAKELESYFDELQRKDTPSVRNFLSFAPAQFIEPVLEKYKEYKNLAKEYGLEQKASEIGSYLEQKATDSVSSLPTFAQSDFIHGTNRDIRAMTEEAVSGRVIEPLRVKYGLLKNGMRTRMDYEAEKARDVEVARAEGKESNIAQLIDQDNYVLLKTPLRYSNENGRLFLVSGREKIRGEQVNDLKTIEELEAGYKVVQTPEGDYELIKNAPPAPLEPGHVEFTNPVPNEPLSNVHPLPETPLNTKLTPTVPTSDLLWDVGSQYIGNMVGYMGAQAASQTFGSSGGYVFSLAYNNLIKDVLQQNTPFADVAKPISNKLTAFGVQNYENNKRRFRQTPEEEESDFIRGSSIPTEERKSKAQRLIDGRSEFNPLGDEVSHISPFTAVSDFNPVSSLVSQAFNQRKSTDLIRQAQEDYSSYIQNSFPFPVR